MSADRTSLVASAAAGRPAGSATPALALFVAAVAAAGGVILVRAALALPAALDAGWGWCAVLALATIVAGQVKINVPGQPATVSVSEFFVFTMVLLFGPAPAVLAVAVDGLWTSLTQQDRRWYRALFNIAEPAIGAWAAGNAYLAVLGPAEVTGGETRALVAVLVMAMTFLASNSVLTAIAVALENRTSAFEVWRRHAFYLGVNYCSAAALAMLAVESHLRPTVVALIAPLLVLSYVTCRAVASRVEESRRHIAEVEHLYQATIETLAIAVDAKDEVTHGHVRRVQRHAVATARALGITEPIEIKAIEAAALLHDVGKLAVPDYVLNKPAALTRSEFEQIKQHVDTGATILRAVEFPYPVVPIVLGHHEQWDGRGYPAGLAGEAIPIGARILSVVDCFDAVTSDRPYRRKLSDEEAIAILQSRAGTMYDRRVVDAFIAMVPALRREDAALDQAAVPPLAAFTNNESVGDGRATPETEAVSRQQLAQAAPAALDRLGRELPAAEICLLATAGGRHALTIVQATPLVRGICETVALPLGEGVSGWVAAHRYRIVNSDPTLDLGDAATSLGLRSCMSVPVFAFGALAGVLSVFLPEPGGFRDREVRLVGLAAQEIGMAIALAEHGWRDDRLDAVAVGW